MEIKNFYQVNYSLLILLTTKNKNNIIIKVKESQTFKKGKKYAKY